MNMESYVRKNRRCPSPHINVTMIPSKIVYLVSYAAKGTFEFYLPIFLVSVGLKVNESALIIGISNVIGTLAGPCWGFLADVSGRRKLIFTLLCLGSAISLFSLPWVASHINYEESTICQDTSVQNNTSTLLRSGDRNVSSNIRPACLHRIPFSSTLFVAMISLAAIASNFWMSLYGTIDSFVMNVITTVKSNANFGTQRLFGSVSYAASSFLTGVVVDNYHHPAMSKYTAIFYVCLPLMVLLIPSGLWLIRKTNWEDKECKRVSEGEYWECKWVSDDENLEEKNDGKTSKIKLVLGVFLNLSNVLFFLAAFVNGLLVWTTLNFLFIFMQDEMGASKTAMGLAICISSVSEVLIFFFAKKIITLLRGPIICVEIGILANCVRLLLIAYAKNIWFCVFVQVLHSFGFALFWAASIAHIQMISSTSIYNTMSCIFTSVFCGAASVPAMLAGGEVYDSYGGKALFKTTAALGGVWLLVMIVYFHVIVCARSFKGTHAQKGDVVEAMDLTSNEKSSRTPASFSAIRIESLENKLETRHKEGNDQ